MFVRASEKMCVRVCPADSGSDISVPSDSGSDISVPKYKHDNLCKSWTFVPSKSLGQRFKSGGRQEVDFPKPAVPSCVKGQEIPGTWHLAPGTVLLGCRCQRGAGSLWSL